MSYITDTDLSYIDSSIQTLKVNVNSSLNSVWIELNNDDVSLNQIWNLMATNASSNIALSKKLDNTTDTFTGTLTVDGCMYLIGNFYQNGSTYVVHAENLNTNADYITLRENAVLQIPDGSVSGILIKNANGTDDVFLGSANDAVMRIGWVNDILVALAAREDVPLNNGYAYWNDASAIFRTFDLKGYTDASLVSLKNYVDNKTAQLAVHAWAGNTQNFNVAKNTIRFLNSMGTMVPQITDAPAGTRNIIWHNSTIKNLTVKTDGNPGAVDNRLRILRNGIDTSLYVTLNNITYAQNTTYNLDVSIYDEIGIRITTGNGNGVPWSWAFEIVYNLI